MYIIYIQSSFLFYSGGLVYGLYLDISIFFHIKLITNSEWKQKNMKTQKYIFVVKLRKK